MRRWKSNNNNYYCFALLVWTGRFFQNSIVRYFGEICSLYFNCNSYKAFTKGVLAWSINHLGFNFRSIRGPTINHSDSDGVNVARWWAKRWCDYFFLSFFISSKITKIIPAVMNESHMDSLDSLIDHVYFDWLISITTEETINIILPTTERNKK